MQRTGVGKCKWQIGQQRAIALAPCFCTELTPHSDWPYRVNLSSLAALRTPQRQGLFSCRLGDAYVVRVLGGKYLGAVDKVAESLLGLADRGEVTLDPLDAGSFFRQGEVVSFGPAASRPPQPPLNNR
jgi:hypothetical protein